MRKLLVWAAADPGAATVWADQRPDPVQRRETLQAVCFKIAESDPRAAMDMAETFGLDDEQDVVENLIAQWSATDPDGALAWAARRDPGEARDALVGRVAFALASSRPADAARLVEQSMTPGAAQADTVAALIQRWSVDDASAARAWAVHLPAGPLRVRARQELAALSPPAH